MVMVETVSVVAFNQKKAAACDIVASLGYTRVSTVMSGMPQTWS
jgi:hypothetical protein